MAFKKSDLRLIVPTLGRSISSKTPGLLVGERVLLGGGAITSTLVLEELVKLDKIFLVDPHLDYITDIAFLVDTCFGRRATPFEVWAHPSVVKALREHFFNNSVWPDFCVLPNKENPSIVLKEMSVGEDLEWDGWRIEACGAVRGDTTGKLSFMVKKDESVLVYAPEGHIPSAKSPVAPDIAIFGLKSQNSHSHIKNSLVFETGAASDLAQGLQNFLK